MIKLVITDLDDTIYSWIGFFIPAFYDMVDEISLQLNVSQEQLLKEFKMVHQQVGSVEYPFATLKLPIVKEKYYGYTDEQVKNELNSVFHRFNSTRKRLLKLYPNVEETLRFFHECNISIIAYTESAEENGFYRLKKLGVEHFFDKIYVSDSSYKKMGNIGNSPKTYVVHGKKPNAKILSEICHKEGLSTSEAIYIGDSLSKDMLMAKQAGIRSVWCNYSQYQSEDLYSKLVAISHWTQEDFELEKQYKNEWKNNGYQPDFTIHSFDECRKIIAKINGEC